MNLLSDSALRAGWERDVTAVAVGHDPHPLRPLPTQRARPLPKRRDCQQEEKRLARGWIVAEAICKALRILGSRA